MDSSDFTTMTPAMAFAHAVAVVGDQTKMAKICGRTQGAVSKRLKAGRSAWPDSILKIEAETGVPCWALDPEFYPPEKYQTPGAGLGVAPAGFGRLSAGAPPADQPPAVPAQGDAAQPGAHGTSAANQRHVA